MFSERIREVLFIRVLGISVCPVFALGVVTPLSSGRHGIVLIGDSPLSSGRQALVLGRTSQRLPKESEKTMPRGGERVGVNIEKK